MTKGFYKKQNDELLYAPTIIESSNYVLLAQDKDSYEYPIDDWYWFESDEDAIEYFGVLS
jgi:hypothetical protein